MNFKQRIQIGLLLSLALLLAIPLTANAGRFKRGDTVQIYKKFWKKWYTGTVLDISRKSGQLKIQYQDGGRLKTEIFDENIVRFPYEEDAIAPARNWTDASGSFQVMAAPLGIYGDTLKIRKPDMAELEVPISKLSDGDQRYIDRIRRFMGGAAAPTPVNLPITRFGRSTTDNEFQPAISSDDRIAILPDPLPSYMKLKEGGAAFGRLGDFSDGEEFGVIIPVGGPDSLVLASAERHPRKGEATTRLIWVSIADNKIAAQQKLPPEEYVLDYHPPSHRLLTYSYIDGETLGSKKKIALAIWEVLPTDEMATPIVRWEAHPLEGTSVDPWAQIIDGRIVLQRWDKGEYVGWNVDQKSVAYRLKQESFRDSLPAFSGTKKYAFLPEQDQVRVFDPMSGIILTALPAPKGSKAVALSEDGKKAAVLDNHQLAVWDLTNANAEPTYFHADDIGRVSVKSMFWLGDDKIMVKSYRELLLFSLTQRIVIWSYQFEYTTKHGDEERPLVHIVNDHLVYGASVRDNNRNEGLAVGNVKLPGPKVADVFDTVNREDLEITKPGERVRLEVRCGDQLNRDVYYAMLAKIEANQWTLDAENPTLIIYADATKGETQSTTYYNSSFLSRGSREVTVSYVPNIYTLKVMKGNDLIWSSRRQSGSPMFMTLREGETAQSKVSESQIPNVSFFKYADIPSRIIHKDYRRGLGTTQVTTRGLIAGALKPPPQIDRTNNSVDAQDEDPFQ
ncbi:SHD1 domain-containing protein [Bremerella cremea]|nr:SHD1 domain-containing protein [Bremerella cremea]